MFGSGRNQFRFDAEAKAKAKETKETKTSTEEYVNPGVDPYVLTYDDMRRMRKIGLSLREMRVMKRKEVDEAKAKVEIKKVEVEKVEIPKAEKIVIAKKKTRKTRFAGITASSKK